MEPLTTCGALCPSKRNWLLRVGLTLLLTARSSKGVEAPFHGATGNSQISAGQRLGSAVLEASGSVLAEIAGVRSASSIADSSSSSSSSSYMRREVHATSSSKPEAKSIATGLAGTGSHARSESSVTAGSAVVAAAAVGSHGVVMPQAVVLAQASLGAVPGSPGPPAALPGAPQLTLNFAQGYQSYKGPPGVQGPSGDWGQPGPRGARGSTGDPGRALQGDTGTIGERGSIGGSGPPGPKGDVGPLGPVGKDWDTSWQATGLVQLAKAISSNADQLREAHDYQATQLLKGFEHVAKELDMDDAQVHAFDQQLLDVVRLQEHQAELLQRSKELGAEAKTELIGNAARSAALAKQAQAARGAGGSSNPERGSAKSGCPRLRLPVGTFAMCVALILMATGFA